LYVTLCACSEPTTEVPDAGPAQRVVTFAPNLAEIMFAVGAGEQLVGVSAWSDYPRDVLELPAIGDAFSIDQEQLSLLEPDLLLVWESGMPAHTVDELRQRGYRVEAISTRDLDDVAQAMLRVGELTGRQAGAELAAAAFVQELEALRVAHQDAEPIDVFFQVSARPLYTINREHFISEIISICGGKSIFDDLEDFAPSVSAESVLDRNPETMLAAANAGNDAFDEWSRWPELAANRYNNFFLLPETIGRGSPRLAAAGRAACIALDTARSKRRASE
jgi:iron complex transport system substrate-binding protein